MQEAEFIHHVDARFPFADAEQVSALIAQARSISPNALFTIPFEVAFHAKRKGVQVDKLRRIAILDEASAGFEHPLKALVFAVARRVVEEQWLTVDEVRSAIKQIARFPNEFQALNVVSGAGVDYFPEVDADCDRVRTQWKAAK